MRELWAQRRRLEHPPETYLTVYSPKTIRPISRNRCSGAGPKANNGNNLGRESHPDASGRIAHASTAVPVRCEVLGSQSRARSPSCPAQFLSLLCTLRAPPYLLQDSSSPQEHVLCGLPGHGTLWIHNLNRGRPDAQIVDLDQSEATWGPSGVHMDQILGRWEALKALKLSPVEPLAFAISTGGAQMHTMNDLVPTEPHQGSIWGPL